MSNIVETPDEVSKHFDMLLAYYEELKAFADDPSSPPGELLDQLEELDLEPIIRIIQSRIRSGASMAEAYLIHSFRDLDSMLAEYAMTNMTRKNYYDDYALDTQNIIDKVRNNVQEALIIMSGSDVTQR